MIIRLSKEYDDIAAIHDALYTYNLSKTGEDRINVHAKHEAEAEAMLACDESGKAHGGIAFHWQNDPRRVFLDYFFLDDTLRGGGNGKYIFEQFLARVKAAGAVRVDLTTNTFQAPGFYQKMGFRIVAGEPNPVRLVPENIHYTMQKEF